jgi:hypothetical protein
MQMLPTLKVHAQTHAQGHHLMHMSPPFNWIESSHALKYFTLKLTKDIQINLSNISHSPKSMCM